MRARIARLRRTQRDAVLRQIEIEEVDAHGSLAVIPDAEAIRDRVTQNAVNAACDPRCRDAAPG